MEQGENSLAVLFVFYNEQENVGAVVESMRNAAADAGLLRWKMILVDNGSTDDTAKIMAEVSGDDTVSATVARNIGLGGGIIEGLRHLGDATHVAICDGDGQIDPNDVIRLYRETDWSRYAMAKANRVQREDGPMRALMSALFNLAFRLLLSVNTDDTSGKPKVMTRKLVDRLDLSSQDFFIDMEIMSKVAAIGAPYVEYETRFLRRHGGKSKVGLSAGLSVLKKTFGFRKTLAEYARRTAVDRNP